MRKIWYEGNPDKIIKYLKESTEMFNQHWVHPDTQIYKSDKFYHWELPQKEKGER